MGSSPSPSLQSWSGTFRLPFLRFCEKSDARRTLRDERGTPESCASMSSGSCNGVLPQGNIQTSRTMGKICTEKSGLCTKISSYLWIKVMYLVFLYNNKFGFIKNCRSLLLVWPTYPFEHIVHFEVSDNYSNYIFIIIILNRLKFNWHSGDRASW